MKKVDRVEYKECIAQTLCPEYDAMLSEATDEHVFSAEFEKEIQSLFGIAPHSPNSSDNSIRDKPFENHIQNKNLNE